MTISGKHISRRAAGERIFTDSGKRLGHIGRLQPAAAAKGFLAYFRQPFGQIYSFQTAALGKRVIADRDNALGQFRRAQAVTAGKGLPADGQQTFGKTDLAEPAAVCERAAADAGCPLFDAGLGYIFLRFDCGAVSIFYAVDPLRHGLAPYLGSLNIVLVRFGCIMTSLGR